MNITLQELINSNVIWNKEKIQLAVEDVDGKEHFTEVDRIEFLAYKYEDYTVDWFESSLGEYGDSEIPIILFHISRK